MVSYWHNHTQNPGLCLWFQARANPFSSKLISLPVYIVRFCCLGKIDLEKYSVFFSPPPSCPFVVVVKNIFHIQKGMKNNIIITCVL